MKTVGDNSLTRCWRRSQAQAEAGLTLIEVLVAMGIFLVISSGVAATLISGLQATAHSRLATTGKAAAQEQIEEMRARPFFVTYSTDPGVGSTTDADLLDRYYPNTSTGHSVDSQGWEGWYTDSGGDAYYTKVSPADSRGIVRHVETRFVDNTGAVIVPSGGYDADIAAADTPPGYLVKVTVTTTWPERGGQGSYTLDSLISSTGQVISDGGVPPIGEDDCSEHLSDSYANVTGAELNTTVNIYALLLTLNATVDAGLGDAHATARNATADLDRCETSSHGWATGGNLDINLLGLGLSQYKGAEVNAVAPPDSADADSKTLAGVSLEPLLNVSLGSNADGEASTGPFGGLEANSRAGTSALNLQLQLLPLVTSLIGLNDLINVSTSDPLGHQASSEITQQNGVTVADGSVSYGDIKVLGLLGAPNGIVYVKNFNAVSQSRADAQAGGASNSLTYTVEQICVVNNCFNLITPQNPIDISLLVTLDVGLIRVEATAEVSSASAAEIANAMTVTPDGTTATINMDALLRVNVNVNVSTGLLIKLPIADINEHLGLGKFDVQVVQQ